MIINFIDARLSNSSSTNTDKYRHTWQRFHGKEFRLGLPSQSKILNDRPITIYVFVFNVIEQATSAPDQHQQASTGVVVLFVHFQMLRQISDTMGQQCGLNFR
jgi:hypothetical protein